MCSIACKTQDERYDGRARHYPQLEERTRLIRLCAMITGNSEIAEDLAQEKLLEAWRHLEGPRDPEKRSQWLYRIARNVCLRWARRRDLTYTLSFEAAEHPEAVMPEERRVDKF